MLVQKQPKTKKTQWMAGIEMRFEEMDIRLDELEAKADAATDMVDLFERAFDKLKKSRILGFFIRRALKHAEDEKNKAKEK